MCLFCLGKHLHIQEETISDLIGTNSNKKNEQSWTRLISVNEAIKKKINVLIEQDYRDAVWQRYS